MEKAKKGILQGVGTRLGLKGKELLMLLLGGVAVICIGYMSLGGGGNTKEAASVAVSTQLEERLASTLSQIKGAGRVRVMVTYSEDEEENSGWFTSTKESKSQVVGVIIVAQGAGDIGVTFELITATRVVLGIKASAVKVFVMDEA